MGSSGSAASGPGTFGSIQLGSAPGSNASSQVQTPSVNTDAYGNGNGAAGGGGYFSPGGDRGDDESTSGGESNGKRYR